MGREQITISVDSGAASAYRSASEEDRRKLDLLLSLKLSEATLPGRPLEEVMREISARAQERGLTPQILQRILDER